MNAHITKPIHVATLLAELDQWIEVSADERARVPETPPSSPEATPHYPDHIPGVDVEEALARIGGNQELFFRLIRQFVDRYQSVIAEIHSTLEIGDAETAMALCHQLTGVAANLSAAALSEAARNLESALNEKRMGTNHLLGILEEEFATINTAVRSFNWQTASAPDHQS